MNQPDDDFSQIEEFSQSLANAPIPEGPDPQVKQQLLASIAAEDNFQRTAVLSYFFKGQMMRRISTVAAVLLVLLASAAFLLPLKSISPSAAFAAMLENIDQLRTVRFTMDIRMAEGPEMSGTGTILAPNLMHQTLKAEMLDYEQVTDFRQAKMLILFKGQKRAQLLEFKDMPESQRQKNYLEDLRQLKEEDVTFLGNDTLDGLPTLKYQYEKAGEYATIWLDEKTMLPLKFVASTSPGNESPEAGITMRDFQWNVEVDDQLFSLDIPEGYIVAEQPALDESTALDDFITTLRFYTKLNDDQFPDQYSSMMFFALPKMLKKGGQSKEKSDNYVREKLADALGQPEVAQMNLVERFKLGMQLQKTFGNGVLYYETTRETHHWHFQGKGVKLGEADKIIAWWYPKPEKAPADADLNTAHVLYGDLRVETMPVQDLPQQKAE